VCMCMCLPLSCPLGMHVHDDVCVSLYLSVCVYVVRPCVGRDDAHASSLEARDGRGPL
jgi:hypothetical protein